MIKFSSVSPTALAALLGLGFALSVTAADVSDKAPAPASNTAAKMPAPATTAPAKKAPLGLAASPALKVATGANAKVGPDGFLSRWLLLDPIPGDGRITESAVRAAAQKEYF